MRGNDEERIKNLRSSSSKPKYDEYHLVIENGKGRKMIMNFGSNKTNDKGRTFFPVLNAESCDFAPTFICQDGVRKKNRDERYYLNQLEERMKRMQLKPANMSEAKPRAKPSNNYCAVCQACYNEEYFRHIKSSSHREKVKESGFHKHIEKVVLYYEQKMMKKEEQERKERMREKK